MALAVRLKLNLVFMFTFLLSLFLIGQLIQEYVYHIMFGALIGYNWFISTMPLQLGKFRKLQIYIAAACSILFISIGVLRFEWLNGLLSALVFNAGFGAFLLLHERILIREKNVK